MLLTTKMLPRSGMANRTYDVTFGTSQDKNLTPGMANFSECAHWKTLYEQEYPIIMILIVSLPIAVWLVRIIPGSTRIPQPVTLFVFGVIIRLLAEPNSAFAMALAEVYNNLRDNASTILHLFVSLFLFGASSALNSRIFLRIVWQCLTLSLFGIVFGGALMTVFVVHIFAAYKWNWKLAILYSVVFQATDPIAIPDSVKGPSGSMVHIGTLLQGEALIDGAIIASLIEYLINLQRTNCRGQDAGIAFIREIIVGATVGVVVTKMLLVFSSRIKNDRVTGVAVPLAACYIAYISSEWLNSSGAFAIVTATIVITSDIRGYNADLNKAITCFWNMAMHLAETLIFVVSGVIVTHYHLEHSTTLIGINDYFWSFVTYLLIIVTRTVTIIGVAPLLRRLDFHVTWKEGVGLVCGAARGGHTLLMSLLIRHCSHAPKLDLLEAQRILFHANIVVILSLLVSVTFFDGVLKAVGFKTISPSSLATMANAVDHLKETIKKSIEVQRMDNFLANINLQWIKRNVHLENPYETKENQLRMVPYYGVQYQTCSSCKKNTTIMLNEQQMREIMNDLSERALKAVEVNYWRQYEKRLVEKDVAIKLALLAETTADKRSGYLKAENIKELMKVNRFYNILLTKAKEVQQYFDQSTARPTEAERPRYIKKMAESILFHRHYELLLHGVIGISLIICLSEVIVNAFSDIKTSTNRGLHHVLTQIHRSVCVGHTTVLTIDISLRCVVFGFKKFFKNFINILLLIVLFTQFINILLSFLKPFEHAQTFLSCISLLLALRMTLVVRVFIRTIIYWIKRAQNMALYNSFEIAHCFLSGEEEVRKKLDYMAKSIPLTDKLKEVMSNNCKVIHKELIAIQQKHPKIAIAARTRLAAREVLNDGIQTLNSLKNEGKLLETEYGRLYNELQRGFDKLLGIPSSFVLRLRPVDILKAVAWLDTEAQLEYFKNIPEATEEYYRPGARINTKGSPSSAVFIIMYGIVRVTGKGRTRLYSDHLPNADSNVYFQTDDFFEDYLSNCQSLGLLGVLNGGPCVTNSVCDTEVRGYSIPFKQVREAMELFSKPPSLEYQMWKVLALEIALPILLSQTHWRGYTPEKLRIQLGNAILPNLYKHSSFLIKKRVRDVVLIQGKAKDEMTGEEYRGPVYIQSCVNKLLFPGTPGERARPILLLLAAKGYHLPEQYDWSGETQEMSQRNRYCLYHSAHLYSKGNVSSKWKKALIRYLNQW